MKNSTVLTASVPLCIFCDLLAFHLMGLQIHCLHENTLFSSYCIPGMKVVQYSIESCLRGLGQYTIILETLVENMIMFEVHVWGSQEINFAQDNHLMLTSAHDVHAPLW